MTVKAYERPSHEILPIIGSEYFTTSEEKYKTEIDNTAPSAVYAASTITKVDVVFALGELSQMKQLEGYMPTFEQTLKNPSNAFDVLVTSVETVTGGFDMTDADASTIYNFWDQYPNPNNYLLYGDYICNLYGRGGYQAFQGNGTNAFDQVFIESKSYDVTDFKMGFGIKLHGCGWASGAVLHWDKDTDEAYLLLCSNSTRTIQLKYVSGMSRYIGGATQPESIGYTIDKWQCNPKTAFPDYMAVASGNYSNVTVSMTGNTMDIGIDGLSFKCDIPQAYYIEKGGLGLFAGCCVAYTDVSLSYETTVRKSLGESISDVAWRDGSVRFIVHATDVIPDECLTGNEADFSYTVTKILNSNAYLINLGTPVSKSQLDRIADSIRQADGTPKGFYYSNIPIYTGLDKSASKIISIAKNLAKPTDWILVNTDVLWNTEYKDNERDVPLNFGEHDGTKKQPQDKSDIDLANSWGLSLTNRYTEDKSLAERWRYKHIPTFYDNSNIQSSFHNIWVVDPIESFENPGKYRVNYKRRDNPLYPNVIITDVFDTYRYWSSNYDRRE